MRFRDQRAQAAAPQCPADKPLELVECPHRCGLVYYAPGQKLSAEKFWRYGPWRMQLHVLGNEDGHRRCVRPLFDGPVQFHSTKAEQATTDEERENATVGT